MSDLISVFFLMHAWVFAFVFIFVSQSLVLEPCDRKVAKQSVGPKMAVYLPFSRKKNMLKKNKFSSSSPSLEVYASSSYSSCYSYSYTAVG